MPKDCAGQIDSSIPATVGVIEPMGARTDVYMTSRAGQKFIATTDPHIRLAIGNAVRACINIERVHIFEPGEAGGNVTLSNPAD